MGTKQKARKVAVPKGQQGHKRQSGRQRLRQKAERQKATKRKSESAVLCTLQACLVHSTDRSIPRVGRKKKKMEE